MREIWVRNVAVLTGVLLVVLSAMFACGQNRDTKVESRAPAAAPDTGRVEAGRALYVAQGCASCHSVAGEGNLRAPLDGVGRRRTAAGIRDWMLGTGPAATELTARSLQAKERFRSLSEADLQALVEYLQSLPQR
jgi:mono/diheme cytochrome c family protein